MKRVECDYKEIDLKNDSDQDIEGIEVQCNKCECVAQAFGRGDKSFKFACRKLNEICPNNENNYYIVPDIEEE